MKFVATLSPLTSVIYTSTLSILMIMKHIINYSQTSLFSNYGSPRHFAISAGVGAMIAGLASATAAGVNGALQYSTNSKNRDFTREGWKLQSEEAEKARDFNSEEAEKAREYYSESAIMQRRKDAGLNTALSGSESATSGPSASGSGASLSSPIPMEAPQFGEIGNALSEAIGNYFGFKQAELQGVKISSDTEKVLQDIVQDRAMHEVSINMNTQIFENLKRTGEEISLKNTQLRNAVRLERIHVNEVFNRFYNDWVSTQMARDNVKIEGGKFLLMYQKDRAKIMTDARNFANSLKLQKTDLEFRYGARARSGSSYDQNSSSTSGSQWNINGKYQASASAHGRVPMVAGVDVSAGIEIGGTYGRHGQETTAEMVGITSSSESIFANSDVGKVISQVEGALLVLESPDSSKEVIDNAIDLILRANYSFEAFQMYYEKLDRFATQQAPGLETLK